VPLNQPLRVESRELRVRGRHHTHAAQILDAKGRLLAQSKGVFIAIDPRRVFAGFLDR